MADGNAFQELLIDDSDFFITRRLRFLLAQLDPNNPLYKREQQIISSNFGDNLRQERRKLETIRDSQQAS